MPIDNLHMEEKQADTALFTGGDKSVAEKSRGAETDVTTKESQVHPQPTSDPLDPLNWPRWRKFIILGIVMWM